MLANLCVHVCVAYVYLCVYYSKPEMCACMYVCEYPMCMLASLCMYECMCVLYVCMLASLCVYGVHACMCMFLHVCTHVIMLGKTAYHIEPNCPQSP